MTQQELETEYDSFIRLVAKMLAAQQEYFDGKKRGYTEPHKLQKCKTLESQVAKKIKEYNTIKDSKQQSLF